MMLCIKRKLKGEMQVFCFLIIAANGKNVLRGLWKERIYVWEIKYFPNAGFKDLWARHSQQPSLKIWWVRNTVLHPSLCPSLPQCQIHFSFGSRNPLKKKILWRKNLGWRSGYWMFLLSAFGTSFHPFFTDACLWQQQGAILGEVDDDGHHCK